MIVTEKILLIGGKGTTVNIAEQIIDAQKNYGNTQELMGFVIDDPALGDNINGIPIVSKLKNIKTLLKQDNVKVLFALYRPDKMRERVELLRKMGLKRSNFTNFQHPTCYVPSSAVLGVGNILLSHTTIQSNVTLGNYNIFNSGVTVEHDTTFGDSNFVAAGCLIGSHVRIGKGNFIGLGSSIREYTVMQDWNFIGMNSMLLETLSSGKLVYGSPARIFKHDNGC